MRRKGVTEPGYYCSAAGSAEARVMKNTPPKNQLRAGQALGTPGFGARSRSRGRLRPN